MSFRLPARFWLLGLTALGASALIARQRCTVGHAELPCYALEGPTSDAGQCRRRHRAGRSCEQCHQHPACRTADLCGT
jgi:hypothetical protein